jgi:glyoxylate reductase
MMASAEMISSLSIFHLDYTIHRAPIQFLLTLRVIGAKLGRVLIPEVVMTKPKIFVTRLIPDEGLAMIRDVADMEVWEDELPPSREVLLSHMRGIDGLVSLLTDAIDAALMDANPRLRVVSNMAVGYDNVDIPAATERGIPVGNTPGVLTDTTADLAFTLMMASGRRIQESIDYVRAGKWKTWGPKLLTGQDIYGSTLGIIGFGRIGQGMARRASGFGMRVLYCDTNRHADLENSMGVTYASMDTLLRESDFVTVHTDLNETTRHMINAVALAKMKKSAILINTARGPIVDLKALYDALQSGRIAGAALDVTEPEPVPADSPLLRLPNCLIVPHIASASVATRARMAQMAAANVVAGVRGDRLPICVNPEVYEKGIRK